MEGLARHKAIVALGSNIDPSANIFSALKRLDTESTRIVRASPQLATEPVGMAPDIFTEMFTNMLVEIETSLDLEQLNARLKDIERQCGANTRDKRDGKVTIDLDLMEYDGERHHRDDWNRQYIKTLIKELK